MRSCLILVGITLALGPLSPLAAVAQSWLHDRAHPQGRGLRLGDFEIHAGLGAEMGWVSNVFLADDPQASAVLRIAPQLEVATPGAAGVQPEARGVDFYGGVEGAFKHYFATEADSDVAIGQKLRLSLRPGSIVGLDVFEEFQRSVDPFTDPIPLPAGEDAVRYGRDRLGVGGRLQLASGGEVLKAGIGYRFDLDHFEDDAFHDDRNRTHTLAADLSWDFYPRSALFWNGRVGFLEYTDVGAMPRASRSDVTPLDSRVGFNGALTSNLSATLAFGYGAVLVANEHDDDTWLGQLELRWRAADSLSWAVGCERGLGPAFQGDYASFNRIKAGVAATPAVGLSVSFRGSVDFVSFGRDVELVRAGADAERDDILLRLGLSGEYRVVEWIALTAEAGYARNFSDFVFPVPGTDGDEAAYDQLQAWLGVRTVL